jgi:multicomponent Na+:H+ antiporter subunit C
MSFLPYAVAVWVLVIGLYGVVTSTNVIHLVISLSVAQSSTYIILLAVGYRTGYAAPVFLDVPRSTPAVDPIVQALTLTDVVVGGTVTALLLAFAVQIEKRLETLDPDELDPLRD